MTKQNGKQIYDSPELNIIRLAESDVILTSGEDGVWENDGWT
jgi:hypothetical protein